MVELATRDVIGTTTPTAMNVALAELESARLRWRRLHVGEKCRLLDRITQDLHSVAEEWATAAAAAKGVPRDSAAAGEEWLTFSFLLRAVAMLRRSMDDLAHGRSPRLPGPIEACGGDQMCVRVFPQTSYDKLFFPGMTSEIRTLPGVSEATIRAEQAALYRHAVSGGATALVLGAGNVSILGPCDILDKLFCEGSVVVYKTHPVTDYLTPLLERGFAALIEGGFLRVVRGGAEEGEYLAHHEMVDELHLTGSGATFETIVFGGGEEGRRRMAEGRRRLEKRFTCELGSVSPVIVVPGPWRPSDLAYQGEHLAAMQVVNAGFNCLSTRVIVQHEGWEHRPALLDEVRRVLGRTPTRPAYYPGAHAIHSEFLEHHPEAECIGDSSGMRLPWTLIADVDPSKTDDICFRREGFCSLVAETAIAADDTADFVDRAVRFVNETLWGSLTATLLVHPASMADAAVAEAVERAVRVLRYGTVGVNLWGVLNYVSMAGSWGAFPGHSEVDIQSGCGTVHNYLMVPWPQKTVIRGPFRQRPKPVMFPSHRTLLPMSRRLVDFEAAPSPLRLPAILGAAMLA